MTEHPVIGKAPSHPGHRLPFVQLTDGSRRESTNGRYCGVSATQASSATDAAAPAVRTPVSATAGITVVEAASRATSVPVRRRLTRRHRTKQSGVASVAGFTLIEVLVALTIIAIALMASLRAVGSITAGADDLRARTLAQWSAENRLTEIRVRGEFPAVGRRNYDCPQGDLLLVCQEDVYSTANPNFRRIEMQVFDPTRSERSVGGALQGGRLARLLGFAVAGGTVGG